MAANTNDSTVKIQLLGYSVVNQDNGNVSEFKNLDELIEKVGFNYLPIIDDNLVNNPSYETTTEEMKMREIATRKKSNVHFPCPVTPFFKRYVESHSSSKNQIFVKANRKVIKEILGISNVNTYSQQQWNYRVKIWKGNCIQISLDVDGFNSQCYPFGKEVENYLTNHHPESERHKVYSIHAIQEHNRHYIYCAEIDGFNMIKHPVGGEDQVTLIPVEIKCMNQRFPSKYVLQAKLGQVSKVLVVIKRDDGTTYSIASCEYDELSDQTYLEEHYKRNLSILGYNLKKRVRSGTGSEIVNYKMIIEKLHNKEMIQGRPIRVRMEKAGPRNIVVP